MARRAKDPKIERSFQGHKGAITGCAFNPKMRQLVTSSVDKTVMLWNFKLRAFRFEGHKDKVLSVDFSGANDLIVSGSKDGSARLWEPSVYGAGLND